MNRKESPYFHQNDGKNPPVSRPRRHDDGDNNTWLGDVEEFYDAYDREPYSREDRAKGRYDRYEDEYPPADEGKSGFSLDWESHRRGKDTRH
ncbi:MAG: hypothetical protein ACXW30_05040 [Micavibrio sp.]